MPINKLLDGYPFYIGSKKILVVDYKGPASYTTGGESLTAKEFGQGGIDAIEPLNKQWLEITQGGVATYQLVAASLSGTYFATIKFGASAQGAVSSVTIQWWVVATGAEVAAAVDLSSEVVRLLGLFI
jgi:hypothetical protein